MTADTALHHRTDGPDDAPVLVRGPSLGTGLLAEHLAAVGASS